MINNILEMRNDYNEIYIQCAAVRDLQTREEKKIAVRNIIKEFNLKYEGYAVLDLIGYEYLR